MLNNASYILTIGNETSAESARLGAVNENNLIDGDIVILDGGVGGDGAGDDGGDDGEKSDGELRN